MRTRIGKRPKENANVTSFLIETMVYAVFILVYFLLVLHFLGGWLKHLYDADRPVYAAVALGLMIGQGALLQFVTGWLLGAVRRKEK